MKNTATLTLLLAVALLAWFADDGRFNPGNPPTNDADTSQIAAAYENRTSDVQVRGEGIVTRILSDDNEGNRHQRFILRLENGQHLLIAHNIDLAPRIDSLAEGDKVAFYGEYEWNSKGGVIHWTHHDPGGHHADGWLKHEGHTYQ